MIGTTFKLGFDGTSVGKGLGNMSKMLGSFGKQMGVGMAQKVGHGITDLMGRIITYAPDVMRETGEWAGNMNDMATQTGVGVDKLIQLEEALRISGASAKDSSRMISVLADNLHEAGTSGGPALDALHKLNLYGNEFNGLGIDESFEKIMRKVAELPPGFKGLESIMADLFGAKMGYKLIRFARDFDGNMNQAANNVSKLATVMKNKAPIYDEFFDGLGRFENFKRSLGSIAIDEVMKVFGAGASGADDFFDKFNPEDWRQGISEFVGAIKSLFTDPGAYFSDLFKYIGSEIGAGFKSAFSLKSLLPSIFGTGGPTSSTGGSASSDLSALIQKSNTLLADIRKEVGVAKFA